MLLEQWGKRKICEVMGMLIPLTGRFISQGMFIKMSCREELQNNQRTINEVAIITYLLVL